VTDSTEKNYKDTLNLPKTRFGMKAALAQREPQWLKQWHKERLYERLMAHSEGRPRFVLHDGPPYANGSIHMGHAVNKVLKDIIIKSKLLSGYQAPYVPGWDCHGLPIEIQVEKKVGKVGQKVDARTFRQKCREYADRQVAAQKQEFQRLGVIGDWDNPYLTKDFQYEADMVRALSRIIENGHVEKGVKPVNWCFDCGSALAEAEIEYQDKTSPSIDVAFAATDPQKLLAAFGLQDNRPVSVPIWTTTPWTLPANQAVALHPELNYALVKGHENGLLVIASDLVEEVSNRYGIESPEVLGETAGAQLEGMMLQHPFYDRQVPIILGEHVTTEAGTGAVHTAPGHGVEDFQVGRQYHLPVDNPVASNGVYLPGTELFAGQHVWKANDTIIDELKQRGALLHVEKIQHSYPHCWRHKTPTAFRTTPQWFISMDKNGLRKAALEEIKQVQWVPDWGQERIRGMVAGRPDWCISRQRTWGVPITVFVHRETGQLHPNTTELMESVARRMEKEGMDAWFDLDPAELLGEDAENYDKITDVLDVWFDSGVSHFAVLNRRDNLHEPADLYLEGSDQNRGWFQSSLLTGTAINRHAPYRQVLTHGFVVDAKGHKMSKSLGNVIVPKQIIDKMGADILRLWVASADYRNEMTISDEILKRVADAYRRIRNTARFLLGNLSDFTPEDALPPEQLTRLDQWAIRRAKALQEELTAAYGAYQFHQVYQKLHHFCSQEMGAFYLDVLKDRLYTVRADSPARRSAQTALYHILQALVRWMAPILTFTADEIRQNMPAGSGIENAHILFATWHEFPAMPAANDSDWSDSNWALVEEIRESTKKHLEELRGSGVIGSSLDAAVSLYLPDDLRQRLHAINDELRFVLITSAAELKPLSEKPAHAHGIEVAGQSAAIAVAPASGEKCVRCWHIRPDVGQHSDHPRLCGRCVINVEGAGETRTFA